jgi:hypothetical protein
MRLKLLVEVDAPDFDLWAQVLIVLPDGSTLATTQLSSAHGWADDLSLLLES